MIREFNNQNSVFGNQSHQGNQSYLAIDVERRESQERESQCAGNRQRHRAGQNDERIAETFKLRREYQIDQNSGKQECPQKFAALNSQLARLPCVIEGESLRQRLLGLLLKKCQSFVQGHRRRNNSLDAHRIQLLKFVQRTRLSRCLQGGERGKRNQLIVRALHINVLELVRI